MRVDIVLPDGSMQASALLRDGEKVEISRDDESGERFIALRIRRRSRRHVVVELLPVPEDTPRERVRLVRPPVNGL